MEEQLISLEIAKLAKEKGFNGEGEYYYLSPDYDILMGLDRTGYNMHPTKKNSDGKGLIIVVVQSLLQKWLREEHSIHIEILLTSDEPYNQLFYRIMKVGEYFTLLHDDLYYDLYEDALEKGLMEALKLIK